MTSTSESLPTFGVSSTSKPFATHSATDTPSWSSRHATNRLPRPQPGYGRSLCRHLDLERVAAITLDGRDFNLASVPIAMCFAWGMAWNPQGQRGIGTPGRSKVRLTRCLPMLSFFPASSGGYAQMASGAAWPTCRTDRAGGAGKAPAASWEF